MQVSIHVTLQVGIAVLHYPIACISKEMHFHITTSGKEHQSHQTFVHTRQLETATIVFPHIVKGINDVVSDYTVEIMSEVNIITKP